MVQQVHDSPRQEKAIRVPDPPVNTADVATDLSLFEFLLDNIPGYDANEDQIGQQDEYKWLVYGQSRGLWGQETLCPKPWDVGHEPLLNRPQKRPNINRVNSDDGSTRYDDPSLQANLGRGPLPPHENQHAKIAFCARQIVYLRARVGLTQHESRIRWDRYPPLPHGVPNDSVWRRACLLGVGSVSFHSYPKTTVGMFFHRKSPVSLRSCSKRSGVSMQVTSPPPRMLLNRLAVAETKKLLSKELYEIRKYYDRLVDEWLPRTTSESLAPEQSAEIIRATEPNPLPVRTTKNRGTTLRK